MNSIFHRRGRFTALAAAALSAALLTSTITPAHAWATVACSSAGVTVADNALATSLNARLQGSMRGQMTGYRVSCARAVVGAVQARGLEVRAATIAMATVIVESTIQNISEEVDHDSLGLFQQRASWGSRQQRLDPVWATNAFLNKMLSLYPDGSWRTRPVGQVAQAVQVSAYPSRYEPQAADGAIIAGSLFSGTGGVAAGDVTGDGFADVLGRRADGSLALYPNGGASASTPYGPNSQIGSGWQSMTTFRVADVTGDGKGDVLAVRNDGALLLYAHGGDNSAPYGTARQVGTGWAGFRQVTAGDVTGDGKADAVAAAGDGALLLYAHGGDNAAPYSTGRQIGTGWAFTHLSAADANADGKADLFTVSADGQLRLYSHTGNVNAPYSTGAVIGSAWQQFDRVHAADVTGDQHADLLATKPDGTLWLYTHTRDNTAPYSTGRQIGSGWTSIA
ncbi:VCBS repeat-containing protein [Actinoplanes sp. DH11]|uniref:FG-GAP repeat domain-containing protein n=1 Tax=Actinoplanes sp. DH11 TaxID=2857011 RepID=UPI001E598357|nr:VCBS repeat-containing protein [Actinoplanes sp. DH11]